MFLAGQASTLSPGVHAGTRRVDAAAKRSSWLWPAATAALAATSLALAFALVVRPGPRVEIVYVERPTAPQAAELQTETASRQAIAPRVATEHPPVRRVPRTGAPAIPANNYVRTRDVALRLGLDALGSPRGIGGGELAPTYQEWRQNTLGNESQWADPMSYLSPSL
jgi:hypothetical protein